MFTIISIILTIASAMVGLIINISRFNQHENVIDMLRKSIASEDYARKLVSQLTSEYHKEPIRKKISMQELYQFVESLEGKQLGNSLIINSVLVDNYVLIFTEIIVTAISVTASEISEGHQKAYIIFSLLKNEATQMHEVFSDHKESGDYLYVKRQFGGIILNLLNH